MAMRTRLPKDVFYLKSYLEALALLKPLQEKPFAEIPNKNGKSRHMHQSQMQLLAFGLAL